MVQQVDSTLVMRSPGEIASRDGVSKQAVSKAIKRLVENNELPVERDGRGRIARVSLAHYDHHRGLFDNPAKAPQRSSAAEPAKAGESFEEARRQNEWLKVTATRLRQAEEMGRLVRADRLTDALAAAGRTIQSEVSRLQNRADDLAVAVSKEGSSSVRIELRKIAAELNARIADILEEIGADAPEHDELLDEVDE